MGALRIIMSRASDCPRAASVTPTAPLFERPLAAAFLMSLVLERWYAESRFEVPGFLGSSGKANGGIGFQTTGLTV